MQQSKHRYLILELLAWIRDEGYWPKKFKADDLFVIPLTNRIERWKNLLPHQKEIALWVPSSSRMREILKEHGYKGLETFEVDGIHFVRLLKKCGRQHSGAGVGPTEALLSALQAVRRGERLAA